MIERTYDAQSAALAYRAIDRIGTSLDISAVRYDGSCVVYTFENQDSANKLDLLVEEQRKKFKAFFESVHEVTENTIQ